MDFVYFEWTWLALIAATFIVHYIVITSKAAWQGRRVFGGALAAAYITTIPLTFVLPVPLWIRVFFLLIIIFLALNASRWYMDRYSPTFLRYGVMRSLVLLYSVLVVMILFTPIAQHLSPTVIVGVGTSIALIFAMLICIRTILVLRNYQLGDYKLTTKEEKLPTVSLAIPARNETHALEETLGKAIRSDYPKLEILVLDDCSQDKTAEVIRSFAHDGVRFVQGTVPASGWMGKNFACATLVEEASGDIIIFAGVDTHFDTQTISSMVSYMLHANKRMLSVLPQRRAFDFWPSFLEQLRNFWQIVLPHNRKRTSIASQCWAIYRKDLQRMGGFAAFKNSVLPEVHFALTLQRDSQYQFVMSNDRLGLTTRKRLSSQLETATRTFYPIAKRRPSQVFFIACALTLLFLLPYGVFFMELFATSFSWTGWLALTTIVLLTLSHLLISYRTNPRAWWFGFINFPILMSYEVVLYIWSMLSFEFGEVNWKGRNVCYPLLRAIPKSEFTKNL